MVSFEKIKTSAINAIKTADSVDVLLKLLDAQKVWIKANKKEIEQ